MRAAETLDSGRQNQGPRTALGRDISARQTWTILCERQGWSRQRPARRAAERNEVYRGIGLQIDH
ncbi:hypothetical protein E1288_44400 [Saccharopolyspora elongata]|uniref:Uncharacterized protein n=1 Tax=Saccharopolyspora elongata TaxID=2530387 RepID=A0A4R4XV44_9PSEU|nr:hypothetical protein E1288_44400 [Saccharopolyspora elongata]